MNCVLISSALMNIALLAVFGILSTNESIHEKECIFPEINTKTTEYGQCSVFTKCEFRQVNETYKLVFDQLMILPTTYKEDITGKNCPRYFDLPGYKYLNNYDQRDIGYGYCELPFNVECSQLMYNVHIGTSSMDHAGTLYTLRDSDNDVEYLSYGKTDEHGTNCPKLEDMLCIDYSSIYDVPILTLIWTLCLLILVNICECVYKKHKLYNLVDKNNEETQKLQGIV